VRTGVWAIIVAKRKRIMYYIPARCRYVSRGSFMIATVTTMSRIEAFAFAHAVFPAVYGDAGERVAFAADV